MRSRTIYKTKLQLNKFRYAELRAFCRQYADKKAEAELLLSVKSPAITGMPHGTDVGRPVEQSAERREKLLKDVELIESCAMSIENGLYYWAIISNVCMGMPYDCIRDRLPTNHRSSYFNARRIFFHELDKKTWITS